MLSRRDPPSQDVDAAAFRGLEHFDGSLAQKTYLSLREAIVGLSVQPGVRLRKSVICEALGVSRSPASEAMTRLASEGLVDVVPQAGTFVARFNMNEIREGAFLREAIELAAIEEIAPRLTEDELRLLRRNLRMQEAMVEDEDFAGFYELDAAFHALLLSFTGYRKLPMVADTAWVHVDRARQLILPVKGRVEETLAEHRAVVEALDARDSGAARAALRHHLRQLMTFLAPLEASRPHLFEPERRS